MATVENGLLAAALDYAERGWRVVPLHWIPKFGVCSCYRGAKCPTPGKHPYGKDWQKLATTDTDKLIAFWEKHPQANVGIQMGEASGLVDFESDDEEQERIFLDLFGGDPPVTCSFISHRGKHRPFQWRPDLPGGAIVKIGSLAVRLGNADLGAMSVFPPSLHPSGSTYQWTNHPDDCPPAPIPDAVMAKLWNWMGVDDPTKKPQTAARSMEHWDRILSGVNEGCRDSSMCSYIGKLLRSAENLSDENTVQVIYKSIQAVNARNRPPLAEEALRKDFLSILKTEQNRRTTKDLGPALRDPPENQLDPDKDLKGMSLVRLTSDPPLFELHAKQFAKADRGCLVLTGEQLTSARQIKNQALIQASYPLPKNFGKIWDGSAAEAGLYERLVFAMEEREAPREQKRHMVVAERLWTEVRKAKPVEDGRDPSPSRCSLLSDGAVVFGFTEIWERMSISADKVTRAELSKTLESLGATWHQHKRFKRLTSDSVARLRDLLSGGDGE